MRHWTRRVATTAVAVGTTLTLGANAAFAHYCAKTNFNEQAHANVTEKAQAWTSGEDFFAMVTSDTPVCFDWDAAQPYLDEVTALIDEHPEWAFMGPGYLANGSLRSGHLPEGFSHELGEPLFAGYMAGMGGCEDEGGPA